LALPGGDRRGGPKWGAVAPAAWGSELRARRSGLPPRL